MKNIHILLIAALFATVLAGCKETDAPSVATASELKSYPGFNRAKIEFTAPSGVESFKVFHGNGQFVEQPVGANPQSVVIDGLDEGEQILRVAMLGDAGTASDPKGVKVTVYGDGYKNGLYPREMIEQNSPSDNSLEMTFKAASAGETGVWVVYINTSGVKDSLQMGSTATSIRIDGIDLEKAYHYYSVYKPSADALDGVASAPFDAKNASMFIFEKANWTIAGFSDEEPGGSGDWGLARNAIDDNATTYWHSAVSNGVVPMPHWIAVDMGGEKKMDGFYFVQTHEPSETGLARHFTFSVSSDGEDWTDVLSGEFAYSRIRQQFPFTARQSARYFRLTIESGYNDVAWSQFCEIDLYNEVEASGINGSVPVDVLVNNKKPFASENPHSWDPARILQLSGWTHNAAATASYDTAIGGGSIVMFAIAGGVDFTTNAKVYQTVNLEAGDYIMMYDCGNYDWGSGVLAYGVIATGETLPDITAVSSSSATVASIELTDSANSPNKVNMVPFTLTSPATVSIGWVYNTFSNGYWTAFYMNEVSLLQNM